MPCVKIPLPAAWLKTIQSQSRRFSTPVRNKVSLTEDLSSARPASGLTWRTQCGCSDSHDSHQNITSLGSRNFSFSHSRLVAHKQNPSWSDERTAEEGEGCKERARTSGEGIVKSQGGRHGPYPVRTSTRTGLCSSIHTRIHQLHSSTNKHLSSYWRSEPLLTNVVRFEHKLRQTSASDKSQDKPTNKPESIPSAPASQPSWQTNNH